MIRCYKFSKRVLGTSNHKQHSLYYRSCGIARVLLLHRLMYKIDMQTLNTNEMFQVLLRLGISNLNQQHHYHQSPYIRPLLTVFHLFHIEWRYIRPNLLRPIHKTLRRCLNLTMIPMSIYCFLSRMLGRVRKLSCMLFLPYILQVEYQSHSEIFCGDLF
jgi:hypothetical protein